LPQFYHARYFTSTTSLLNQLGLGIEYQGRQHYDPVPFFGGEEGLQKTRERDELKAGLCSENGVALVIFRYDETLTKELVKARMQRALESRLLRRPENGF
jgi:hypothetical protein